MSDKAFRYKDRVAPAWYACAKCGATGVKLWRPAHDDRPARCASCVERHGNLPAGAIGKDGRVEVPHGDGSFRTDQAADHLPYVPCEDGESTWGYMAVPPDGVEWWHALPTKTVSSAVSASLLAADEATANGDKEGHERHMADVHAGIAEMRRQIDVARGLIAQIDASRGEAKS